MEVEKLSMSSPSPTPPMRLVLPDDDNTLVTSLGRSFGSGPKRVVEVMRKHCGMELMSSFLQGLDFGFFGVRDWLLALLVFLAVGGRVRLRVRDGREWCSGFETGRGSRGG